MEEEVMLNDHERRIVNLEQGQEEIKEQMGNLSRQVSAGNTKAEKDNTYLREQNDKMFEKIIELNTRSRDQKHELKLLDKQNLWKLVITIGGSVSIIQLIVDYFTK
jgi:hypothetical protein